MYYVWKNKKLKRIKKIELTTVLSLKQVQTYIFPLLMYRTYKNLNSPLIVNRLVFFFQALIIPMANLRFLKLSYLFPTKFIKILNKISTKMSSIEIF